MLDIRQAKIPFISRNSLFLKTFFGCKYCWKNWLGGFVGPAKLAHQCSSDTYSMVSISERPVSEIVTGSEPNTLCG